MKKGFALIFALLLFAFGASAYAQTEPGVTATITPDSGTIGDVFTYTAVITWPSGIEVLPPDPADSLGDMTVLSRKVSDLEQKDGVFTLTVTLALSAYKPGEITLPPLKVQYNTGDGEPGFQDGPALSVNILRTVPEDVNEIRDIKGPDELPTDLIRPLLFAAGILAAFALAFLIFSLFRRKKKKAQKAVVEKPEPYPFALSRFESGLLDELLEKQDVDGYYVELTDILREYLEGRFGVFALEKTTEEIARDLRSAPVDGFLKTELVHLLRRADRVKFARLDPPPETCREDKTAGRNFVEKTRPEPAIPEPDKNGKGGKA